MKKDNVAVKQLNTIHGGGNKYKFQTFSERLSQIDVDVLHRVGQIQQEPQEGDSFFAEAIIKWKELNCTAHFAQFLYEVEPRCKTLPMLLFNKALIIEALIKHLRVKDSMALQPLLILVSMLARDLQDEFYPYFKDFFDVMVDLLAIRDPETIEHVFTCLSFMLKHLLKFLLEDVETTFRLFKELLGHIQYGYVRQFGAEVFAFLLRKIKTSTVLEEKIRFISEETDQAKSASLTEGVAVMFFEVVKGVQQRFHSRTEAVLHALFSALRSKLLAEEPKVTLNDTEITKILEKNSALMCQFTKREYTTEIWTLLFNTINRSLKEAKSIDCKEAGFEVLAGVFRITTVWVISRKGSRVADMSSLFNQLKEIANAFYDSSAASVSVTARMEFAKLVASTLMIAPLDICLKEGRGIVQKILSDESPEVFYFFSKLLVESKWPLYEQILLPALLNPISLHWESNVSLHAFHLAYFLSHAEVSKVPSQYLTSQGTIRVVRTSSNTAGSSDDQQTSKKSARKEKSSESITDCLLAILHKKRNLKQLIKALCKSSDHFQTVSAEPSLLFSALQSVKLIHFDAKSAVDAALNLLRRVWTFVTDHAQDLQASSADRIRADYFAHSLLGTCLDVASALIERDTTTDVTELWKIAREIVKSGSDHQQVLHALAQSLSVIKSRSPAVLDESALLEALVALQNNLKSHITDVRLQTLHVLALYKQIPRVGVPNDSNQIFQLLIDFENIPLEPQSSRDKCMQLRKAVGHMQDSRMDKAYRKIGPLYLVGLLGVNFSPIWPEAIQGLQKLAEFDTPVFWEIIFPEVEKLNYKANKPLQPINRALWSDFFKVTDIVVYENHNKSHKAQVGVSLQDTLRDTFFGHAAQLQTSASSMDTEVAKYLLSSIKPPEERLDHLNFLVQLLKAFAAVPAIIESNSKDMVSIFLTFMAEEYDRIMDEDDDEGDDDDEGEIEEDEEDAEENEDGGDDGKTVKQGNQQARKKTVRNKLINANQKRPNAASSDRKDDEENENVSSGDSGLHIFEAGRRALGKRLLAYLGVFSKFQKPANMHRADEVKAIFMRLLAKGDAVIQQAALECILTWHHPALNAYVSNLKNIVTEKLFREELANLSVNKDTSIVNQDHRPVLMPVLMRILFGKMAIRKGLKKGGVGARRAAIFSFVGGCQSSEMGNFLDLILEPFANGVVGVPLRKKVGFLKVMDDVVRYFGAHVEPFLPRILNVLVPLLHEAHERTQSVIAAGAGSGAVSDGGASSARIQGDADQDEDDDEHEKDGNAKKQKVSKPKDGDNADNDDDGAAEEGEGAATEAAAQDRLAVSRKLKYRQIRQQGFRRLKDLFELEMEFDFEPTMRILYPAVIQARVQVLDIEHTQSPAGLLEMFATWSRIPRYTSWLETLDADLVPKIFACLRAKRVATAVINTILNIADNLISAFLVSKMSQLPREDSNVTTAPAQAAASATITTTTTTTTTAAAASVVSRFIVPMVEGLGHLLEDDSGNRISAGKKGSSSSSATRSFGRRAISLLAQFAPHVKDRQQADRIVQLLMPALLKESRVVPEKIKADVLSVIADLIPHLSELASIRRSGVITEQTSSQHKDMEIDNDRPQGKSKAKAKSKAKGKSTPKRRPQNVDGDKADDDDAEDHNGNEKDDQNPLPAKGAEGGLMVDAQGRATGAIAGTFYFACFSRLFSTLVSRECRTMLCRAFTSLLSVDPSMSELSTLIADLNAFSARRIDDPDYDRRLEGYATLNEKMYRTLHAAAWLPVVHNLIFYMQDMEDISIRNAASFGLFRLIELSVGGNSKDASGLQKPKTLVEAHESLLSRGDVGGAKSSAPSSASSSSSSSSETAKALLERAAMQTPASLLEHIVWPAIKRGMSSPEESVRQEFLSLLARLVKEFPADQRWSDMVPLTVGDDEDASFFTNIYHLQMHRRTRALRRLADYASTGKLGVGSIVNVLFPLISHSVLPSGDRNSSGTSALMSGASSSSNSSSSAAADHNVVNEVITTIGVLSRYLPWNRYYATLRRFLGALSKKPQHEKALIRVIVALIDNFTFDVSLANIHVVKPSVIKVDGSKFKKQSARHEATNLISEIGKERLDILSKGLAIQTADSKNKVDEEEVEQVEEEDDIDDDDIEDDENEGDDDMDHVTTGGRKRKHGKVRRARFEDMEIDSGGGSGANNFDKARKRLRMAIKSKVEDNDDDAADDDDDDDEDDEDDEAIDDVDQEDVEEEEEEEQEEQEEEEEEVDEDEGGNGKDDSAESGPEFVSTTPLESADESEPDSGNSENDALKRASKRSTLSKLSNRRSSLSSSGVILTKKDDSAELDHQQQATVEKASKAAQLATRIYSTLINSLLPELHRHLKYESGDNEFSLRVPVALAIVKLLQQLPEVSMKLQLPRPLTTVCQILRSRSQETRNVARETLVKIYENLGPKYFGFIIKELRSALRNGYQLHILGYTVHALLAAAATHKHVPTKNSISSKLLDDGSSNELPEATSSDAISVQLDVCLGDVLAVIMDDCFGQVALEKEAQEIASKMKETKASKGFDSLELLAKMVSFDSLLKMLEPFRTMMEETMGMKTLQNMQECLRRIAVGVNSNQEVQVKDLVLLVHSLITENLDIAKPVAKSKLQSTALDRTFRVDLRRAKDFVADAESSAYSANAHLFIELGLMILIASLKKNRFDVQDREHLSLLDPMIRALTHALNSKHNSIVRLSARNLTVILRLPLPSVSKFGAKLTSRTMQLLSRATTTASEMAQVCLKLLTTLLRDCPTCELSELQLRTLITLVKTELEQPERQSTIFALLKAVVHRRFVTPEVYDIMDEVGRVMVVSQSSQCQEMARQVMLQFLMDYPMGKKRLDAHMNFLVRNLGFEFESGRMSVLEFLASVMTKFPDQVVVEFAQLFLLALTLRLANDTSAKCREMAGMTLKILFTRLSKAGNGISGSGIGNGNGKGNDSNNYHNNSGGNNSVDNGSAASVTMTKHLGTAVTMLCTWMETKQKAGLRRVAIQAVGLLAEACGKTLQSRFADLVRQVADILEEAALEKLEETVEEQTMMQDATSVLEGKWDLCYNGLITIQKLLTMSPTYTFTKHCCEHVWPSVQKMLLYPHSWVRLAAARLIGYLFAMVDPETGRFVKSAGDVIVSVAKRKNQSPFHSRQEEEEEEEEEEDDDDDAKDIEEDENEEGEKKHEEGVEKVKDLDADDDDNDDDMMEEKSSLPAVESDEIGSDAGGEQTFSMDDESILSDPHGYLSEGDVQRRLARLFTDQLRSPFLSQELGSQIVRNLFFLAKMLFYHFQDAVSLKADANSKHDNDDDADMDDEADLEADVDAEISLSSKTGKKGQQPKSAKKNAHIHPLQALLNRLAYVARVDQTKNKGTLLRTCIFQCFAAVANFLPKDFLLSLLTPIVFALYRTINDETVKGKEFAQLKSLAEEAIDLLQHKVGTTQFLAVYNKVRGDVAHIRQERKQKRVVMAVTNPEAAAKRKMQRSEMKKNSRKRKAEAFASTKLRVHNRVKRVKVFDENENEN